MTAGVFAGEVEVVITPSTIGTLLAANPLDLLFTNRFPSRMKRSQGRISLHSSREIDEIVVSPHAIKSLA
jgi:hypothetical protein